MSVTADACPAPKTDNSELNDILTGQIRKARREAVRAIARAALARQHSEMSDLHNTTRETAQRLSATFDALRGDLNENLRGQFATAAGHQLDRQKKQLGNLQ